MNEILQKNIHTSNQPVNHIYVYLVQVSALSSQSFLNLNNCKQKGEFLYNNRYSFNERKKKIHN